MIGGDQLTATMDAELLEDGENLDFGRIAV